jgi:hypothetical protein
MSSKESFWSVKVPSAEPPTVGIVMEHSVVVCHTLFVSIDTIRLPGLAVESKASSSSQMCVNAYQTWTCSFQDGMTGPQEARSQPGHLQER